MPKMINLNLIIIEKNRINLQIVDCSTKQMAWTLQKYPCHKRKKIGSNWFLMNRLKKHDNSDNNNKVTSQQNAIHDPWLDLALTSHKTYYFIGTIIIWLWSWFNTTSMLNFLNIILWLCLAEWLCFSRHMLQYLGFI